VFFCGYHRSGFTGRGQDGFFILASARKTGAVVTAEEHLVAGGLGELVSGLVARHHPVPMRMVAMDEGFGQSGTPRELMNHYELDAAGIVKKVCELR